MRIAIDVEHPTEPLADLAREVKHICYDAMMAGEIDSFCNAVRGPRDMCFDFDGPDALKVRSAIIRLVSAMDGALMSVAIASAEQIAAAGKGEL